MTQKRDLKRRVRARQERTGESYTEARRRVTAARPDGPFPVVEGLDATEIAEEIGLRCRVSVAPDLAARVDPRVALLRLRDALLGTTGDPSTEMLRTVLVRGDNVAFPIAAGELVAYRRFLARARSGIGGASASGRMLAIAVEARAGGVEMVLFLIWPLPAGMAHLRPPTLIVTTVDGVQLDPLSGAARSAP
jgi:hypothetical protein